MKSNAEAFATVMGAILLIGALAPYIQAIAYLMGAIIRSF